MIDVLRVCEKCAALDGDLDELRHPEPGVVGQQDAEEQQQLPDGGQREQRGGHAEESRGRPGAARGATAEPPVDASLLAVAAGRRRRGHEHLGEPQHVEAQPRDGPGEHCDGDERGSGEERRQEERRLLAAREAELEEQQVQRVGEGKVKASDPSMYEGFSL